MRDQKIDRPWWKAYEPVEVQGDTHYNIFVHREIIPIVLVPGIMGSRLRNAEGAKLWDPDAPLFMLRKYGAFWIGATDRQETLFGAERTHRAGYAVVHEDDPSHNKKKVEKKSKGASQRGWGGVAWSSYQAILEGLEKARWSPSIDRCFELPVYACGYDWQGSCSDAGAHLAARVRKIIDEQKAIGPCEQVVLVTHSMGGLVARSACHDHGLEKAVLGVVHTVQPVSGAPIAYWRMKAGFERHGFIDPLPWVLGTDGKEVTSLLCNMTGGLQLLPNKAYRDRSGRSGWLRFIQEGQPERPLPEKGDPYPEIYENEVDPWRLVLWKEYIVGKRPREAPPKEVERAWIRFQDNLAAAKEFHDRLGTYQHPFSHHVYGTGSATADVISLALYKGSRPIPRLGAESDSIEDRGSFKFHFLTPAGPDGRMVHRNSLVMGHPEGDGDGTVPISSATLLVTSKGGGQRLLWGARDFERTGTEVNRYEHESVFKDGPSAVETVIEAIKAMCTDKIRQKVER